MGTSPWEPLLGNLYLGTSIREPGGMGFGAAPLCSETFTMAEDPSSLRCWGKKEKYKLCREASDVLERLGALMSEVTKALGYWK